MPKPPVPTRKIPRQATSRVAFVSEPPEPGDPLLAFEPYRHKQPRSNAILPDLQREFVAHLAATGVVTSAARHIGKSMEALYKLRHRPGAEGFARAWDRAVQLGVERLEDTALARAIEGSERKIIRGGEVVATERFHNEALVMFFLRNRLADRYASNAHIHPGHPIYERIRAEVEAEVEAERIRQANDPENIRKIRESIDRKVEAIRKQVEWEKARAKAEAGAGSEDEGEETRL
ncbi:MAG: hypothetical protein AAFY42_09620 [Pseudomonadota bacterium]